MATVYEGEFRNNQMHGTGTFTWENQDRYTGQFNNSLRTGRGVFTWQSGEQYSGDFVAGALHGEGTYRFRDGRQFTGTYSEGEKNGEGVFQWPNGNRYVGDFRDDQRHGRGIFYWRDGTVYRGQFEINKMNGWGVKRQPDGVQEIQHWQDGVLTLSTPIVRQARCELSYLERKWMFDSPTCINALAHGSGVAASLDGQYILLDARFVLGQLVEGRLLELPVDTEAGFSVPESQS